jgi:hypothetical protein
VIGSSEAGSGARPRLQGNAREEESGGRGSVRLHGCGEVSNRCFGQSCNGIGCAGGQGNTAAAESAWGDETEKIGEGGRPRGGSDQEIICLELAAANPLSPDCRRRPPIQCFKPAGAGLQLTASRSPEPPSNPLHLTYRSHLPIHCIELTGPRELAWTHAQISSVPPTKLFEYVMFCLIFLSD